MTATTSPSQHSPPNDAKNRSASRKRRKPRFPQPGEPGYKTPTQLRNERKRRAAKMPSTGTESSLHCNAPSGTCVSPTNIRKKRRMLDPSCRYLDNPLAAPVVMKAFGFFKQNVPQCCPFKIHPLSEGAITGWRTVAKLAVRANKDGEISIGLFAPNSHTLLPVPNCPAHHPSINRSVAALEQLLNSSTKNNNNSQNDYAGGENSGAVTAYDESTGKGHLRHIAINVERSTGKVQMTLVWNSDPYGNDNKDYPQNKILDALIDSIIKCAVGGGRKRRRGKKGVEDECRTTSMNRGTCGNEMPEQQHVALNLHSLWIHFNASWKHSNAIFAVDGGTNSWKHVFGPPFIEETLLLTEQSTPVALRFPPNVFRQANLDAFTKIVQFIRETLKEKFVARNPACVELYGGVGTIGLNVADLVSPLISSDENPFNRDCFLAAAALLPDSFKCTYESKNASAMVRSGALEKGTVIIVDPPRKGLDDDVLVGLCNSKIPELLVYVSCGFDAFQRDCNVLLQSGWKLDHAEGHLLFPGSDAIETVACFTRL